MQYLNGGEFVLRDTVMEDSATVLRDIRKEDVEEWRATEDGGLMWLPRSINESDECWTIARTSTGVAHIIFGVVQHEGQHHGTVWMLGTNEGQRMAATLFIECRGFTQAFFKRWAYTQCWSDARNTKHHEWLEWMGFKLAGTPLFGPLDYPFHHYIKEPR